MSHPIPSPAPTDPALPVVAGTSLADEVAALAQAWRRANGPVMAVVNRLGGRLEDQVSLLPEALRGTLERATGAALEQAMSAAALGGARAPRMGRHGPLAAAVASGAAGGAGGLATALAELPVTIAVMLHAIRREARAAGFDPDDPAIRAECLRVFEAGSPLAADDGVNSAFLSSRLSLTGQAVAGILQSVVPRLAAAMGQKLAAQMVPVLGALSGAALNAAFLTYYAEIARIRFALLRLAARHGAEPVMLAFATATRPAPLTRAGR